MLLLLTALFVTVPLPLPAGQQPSLFPAYPVIAGNVQFWKDIYSKYSNNQGVLHDKNHPELIYTVIDLMDWREPGASAVNDQLIQTARQRCKKTLDTIAKGKPVSREDQRIAGLLKKHRISAHHAYDAIRMQTGQKEKFLEGVIRSGAWMAEIKKIFKSYGLPPELAYLPHVESSFNLDAHSKAAAVGIWQFMRSTGSAYMTINDVLDERYDVLISTHAAARFLKENHRRLGNWPLALTAYNHGRAGMVRAQRAHGDFSQIYKKYQNKNFGFASKNFYAEFLAALQVARQLEQDPKVIQKRPEAIIHFRLPGFASIRDLHRYFQVAPEDFERLNPALREPAIEGKKLIPKGALIHLPASERMHRLVAEFPADFIKKSQIPDRIHIVQRGDTAYSVARKYGTTAKKLMGINDLDRHTPIRIGQRLKIPQTTASN